MSSVRRVAAVAVALFSLAVGSIALGVPAASAAPAANSASAAPAAATGYTYWGYYQWSSTTSAWEFKTVGANDNKQLAEDGDVYGFRWALQVKDPRLPRADADFDALCAATPEPEAGEKRIGFVLDYGSEADAPDGETPPEPRGACAIVDEEFTTQQALQTVAELRIGEDGRICGIDAYPAQGCGDVVKNAEEGPADQPVTLAMPDEAAEQPSDGGGQADVDNAAADSDDGGFPWGVAIAGAVIIALAFGALALRRRQG